MRNHDQKFNRKRTTNPHQIRYNSKTKQAKTKKKWEISIQNVNNTLLSVNKLTNITLWIGTQFTQPNSIKEQN